MDSFLKAWVDVLQDDVDKFQRAADRERDRLLRAVYILRVAQLKRAIDRLILGAAFEAASLRARNHFRR